MFPVYARNSKIKPECKVRKEKAARTKHLGEPLDLPAKPLDIIARGNEIWIAQSDATIRRIDLEVNILDQAIRARPNEKIVRLNSTSLQRTHGSGNDDCASR